MITAFAELTRWRGWGVDLSSCLGVGLFLAVIAVGIEADAFEVTASASTDAVQVAEPFTLDVTVTASPGSKVVFPAVTEKLGQFDVRDTKDVFDVPSGDDRIWKRRLTLESIVTGDLQIQPLDIRVSENGEVKTVQTRPVRVRVASVLEDRADPTKFRDIQSVVELDVPDASRNRGAWWIIAAVTGVVVLAIVGLVRSRRGGRLTPRDWAVAELDELETSLDGAGIDSESASQGIAGIVRDYLLLQFGITDAGRTPQELVREVAASGPVSTESIDRLENLFALADQARFAGRHLSQDDLRSAIADSRGLVQQIASELETTATTT